MRFEYFRGRDKKWYVRQKGDNGEIMYVSEGLTKANAKKSIATVQREAARAKVLQIEIAEVSNGKHSRTTD